MPERLKWTKKSRWVFEAQDGPLHYRARHVDAPMRSYWRLTMNGVSIGIGYVSFAAAALYVDYGGTPPRIGGEDGHEQG